MIINRIVQVLNVHFLNLSLERCLIVILRCCWPIWRVFVVLRKTRHCKRLKRWCAGKDREMKMMLRARKAEPNGSCSSCEKPTCLSVSINLSFPHIQVTNHVVITCRYVQHHIKIKDFDGFNLSMLWFYVFNNFFRQFSPMQLKVHILHKFMCDHSEFLFWHLY